MNELQILITGQKIITTKDWQLQISQARAFWDDLNIQHFDSEETKNKALNFQKKISDYRDYIKDTIKQLDDEEILNLRIALTDFDKLLASKNGDIKRAYDKWKTDEKKRQIDEGFDFIVSQTHFRADKKVFESDYLDAIKGKNYKEFFEISQKIAFDYSNMLERNQLKFDKYFSELKNYCQEIGYNFAENYLEILAKEIVSSGISFENQKEELKKANQDFKDKEFKKIEFNKKQEELKKENLFLKYLNLESDKLVLKGLVAYLSDQSWTSKLNKESRNLLNHLIEQINDFLLTM